MLLEPQQAINLGARIKEMRRANGRTLVDVANACGLDHSQLSRLEAGQFRRFAGNVQKVCVFLKVPPPTPVESSPDLRALHARIDVLAGGRPRGAAMLARLVEVLEEFAAPTST